MLLGAGSFVVEIPLEMSFDEFIDSATANLTVSPALSLVIRLAKN
jgi:hypothetical protein